MGRRPHLANRRRSGPVDPLEGFGAMLAGIRSSLGMEITEEQAVIPEDMTFRRWCEKLAAEGLKVDGKPFRLDDRPALAWIYDQIPSTRKEARRQVLVLMKCSQVGFTVMEMLAVIYLALKFGPATVGLFLPDQALAELKSSKRFTPIVRSIPAVHAMMTDDPLKGAGGRAAEGSARTRQINESLFLFSWTSGKVTTESMPMDILSFDEVQEMSLGQMEKTMERLSASSLRFTLMGSTANWPDSDIHHHFKLGTQHEFHTRCPTCGAMKPLADYFPACVKWDDQAIDSLTGRPGVYRYVCQAGHWIDDSQQGSWIAANPDARVKSIHFPQMLSPTVTPGEIMEKYQNSTDKKNFWNRVLGKPFLDPSQVPVTLEHMAACVTAGKAAGIKWKKRGRGCFMGIDQMGNCNVVVIKERLEDGRQAVVHIEEIYSDDPFARCSELMELYSVAVCVVEINPNYNEAKRFSARHRRKVFICDSFGNLPDEMVRWGDAGKLDPSQRRTTEEARDRHTVRVDQYKCMQTSFERFTAEIPTCLWPDPQELFQNVIEKGVAKYVAVAPRAFAHFTKTALVAEKDEETNQFKRVVKKIGVDPHFSYANQLCDVAWSRAHRDATFLFPDSGASSQDSSADSVPDSLATAAPEAQALMQSLPRRSDFAMRCGACKNYKTEPDGTVPVKFLCPVYCAWTYAVMPACPGFNSADE